MLAMRSCVSIESEVERERGDCKVRRAVRTQRRVVDTE